MGKGGKLCAAGAAGAAVYVAYEVMYDEDGNVVKGGQSAEEQWPTWKEMRASWDEDAEEFVEEKEMIKEKWTEKMEWLEGEWKSRKNRLEARGYERAEWLEEEWNTMRQDWIKDMAKKQAKAERKRA